VCENGRNLYERSRDEETVRAHSHACMVHHAPDITIHMHIHTLCMCMRVSERARCMSCAMSLSTPHSTTTQFYQIQYFHQIQYAQCPPYNGHEHRARPHQTTLSPRRRLPSAITLIAAAEAAPITSAQYRKSRAPG